MTKLRCTHVDFGAGTRMFHEGGVYDASPSGYQGSQFLVVDDLGHQRVISADDLRFLVRNLSGDRASLLFYAHFEVAEG